MRQPDGTYRHQRRSDNIPGHAHELTFTCSRGLPLLNNNGARRWLVDAFRLARQTHELDIWAYVIMPEHVHILLWPRRAEYDVAAILKTIKQSVSRRAMRYLRSEAPHWLDCLAVPRGSGRVEHRFWQAGGGYDRNIVEAATIALCIKYIHNNPVMRGLVACATDWIWSSARWYDGFLDVPLAMDPLPADVEFTEPA
jgi:putative transposase